MDIEITTVIPEAIAEDFRTAFLRMKPIPIVDGEPTHTDKQWIEKQIKRYLVRNYKRGKALLNQDAMADDPIFGS